MKKILNIITVAAAFAITACGNTHGNGTRAAQELSGAGATFPLPFYNVIFEQFALAYNLPGVDNLNLNGEAIAEIFAGVIKKWNDPKIAALNPGVVLPDEPIIPVFRSDGSGTTFVFTDYLTKASAMWAGKFGAGKSVNFPAGQAAKGNPGVAGVIAQTRNSIGYVGSEYAFAQKIPYATLQNRRGELIILIVLKSFYSYMALRFNPVHLAIILVVILRLPEFPCRGNFGYNIIPFPLEDSYDFFCTLLFVGSLIEDFRAVLRPYIHPLAVQLGRVMYLHKEPEQGLVTYNFRIVSYLNCLGMPCSMTFHLLVCRVLLMASHIPGNHSINTFLLLHQMLRSPEAPSCKICFHFHRETKLVKNCKF